MNSDFSTSAVLPSPHWLDEFTVRAKIDFITIEAPNPGAFKWYVLNSPAPEGLNLRIEIPEDLRKVKRSKRRQNLGNDWVTIHDPTMTDLQFLIDHIPEQGIVALEVTVDLLLRDGGSDRVKLEAAHKLIVKNLFPQKHSALSGRACRKRYDETQRRPVRDALNTKNFGTTAYWQQPRSSSNVRCYLKEDDPRIPTPQHSVRIEAHLERDWCQDFNIHRVFQLQLFAPELRKELSKLFFVARGVKTKTKRLQSKNEGRLNRARQLKEREEAIHARKFNQYGAQWAAERPSTPAHEVATDSVANERIGGALGKLRTQFLKLKSARNSGQLAERWDVKTLYLLAETISPSRKV